MAPFFSLILPCYNVEAYVERCVRSILGQQFNDYEIILVDDGAKDNTPEICDRLATENACIQVIHKKNGGLSSARNAGLAVAGGQYVWFVDSDDWIEPDALMLLHAACADGAPEIVKFGYFRAAQSRQQVGVGVQPGLYEGDGMLEPLRRCAFCKPGTYTLSAWSHVYKREFLKAHALCFVSERIVCSEDYLFNLQALIHVRCMRVIQEPLYTYELRSGSLTQSYKPDLPQRYAELHRQLRERCGEYGALADRFYVWHLAAGTCIPHEYQRAGEMHSILQARENVRMLLKTPGLKKAAFGSDREELPWRRRIQLWAIVLGYEPLFYYLHVVKPARQRKSRAKGMML